jgi:serine/threonine-protein kinase
MHSPPPALVALADRYRVERALGAGGMADVFLAWDVRHDRHVALKVLRTEIAASHGRERFLREIRLAARLAHPHILPLYDSGEVDGILYFVMPVMEGQSLGSHLAEHGPLPFDMAARVAREVADALDYAHRHDVVHRDIKPDNILLHEGHAVVADFGIGKAMAAASPPTSGLELTQIGMIVGTPAYMSPEQAIGDVVDGRSDFFSLGCVLFEMLTGRLPFTGPSLQALIVSRIVHAPPDLAELRPGAPPALVRTVAWLLAKEPEDRPQTGRDGRRRSEHRVAGAGGARLGPVGGGAPLRERRSRCRRRVLRRRRDRGDHQRALAAARAAGGRAHVVVRVQRAARGPARDRREARRAHGARGERAAGRPPHPHHGAAHQRSRRVLALVGALRPRDDRRLRPAGRDRRSHRGQARRLAARRTTAATSAAASPPPTRAGPANLEAYELLLRGRVLLAQRGRSLMAAVACFERALTLDPALAEAHALFGDAMRLIAIYGLAPTADVVPRARAAAERALALDPQQVEALATLASLASCFDWDMAASSALTERALAIDPRHVRALVERALVNSYRRGTGELVQRQALHDLGTAARVDPLNPWAAAIYAMSLSACGRHDDAVAKAQRAIALDPAVFTGHWSLVWALGAAGRDREALEAAEPALRMSDRGPRVLAEVAAAHARLSDVDRAEQVWQEIAARAAAGYVGWAEQGVIAASAGRVEEARALLARGIEARDSYLAWRGSPAWGPLRGDPVARVLWQNAGP